MPNFKKGSRWSARDAQYTYDGVEKFYGMYELDEIGSGLELVYGVAKGDIEAGTTTGEAILWDNTVTPPVATTTTISGLVYDWLSTEVISDGKQIIWASINGFDRILFAECQDPLPPNIATIVVSPRPEVQILTTTYEYIEGMALEYSSGSGIVWDGLASGFGIDEPGTWTFDVNFIAEATANNTDILMRSRTGATTGQPLEFFIKTSGDSVSGVFNQTFSVTQAALDAAGGTVALVVEVATGAGTETISWLSCAITCARIGADNG